jgi:hypothetical protein
MSLNIDPRDGLVKLPNAYVITAHLTQDGFRAGECFAAATVRDVGTRPFIHYHFACGEVEEKQLLANLIFYDQMLLSMELTADLYPPGPKDWSNYSLEVEAATKRFHEDLLRRMLGEPSICRPISHSQRPPELSTLDQPCSWRFPWGKVDSFHDDRSGGTFICISYGDRLEEANSVYRSRKTGAA